MRSASFSFVSVCLLCLSGLLLLAPSVRADIVGKIQKTYEQLESFDSSFIQILRNTASGEEQERKGMLFFKNPDLVRWETTEPESELLIVGKSVVWDYFDDEGVVYKYSVDEVLDSKTMVRFISGQARLDRDFWIEKQPAKGNLVKLHLTPKEPEPQLVEAWVWVDPQTSLVRRILLQDFYGNENELIFSDMRLNPDMPDSIFEFTPPQGVEVFDNTVQFGVQDLPQ